MACNSSRALCVLILVIAAGCGHDSPTTPDMSPPVLPEQEGLWTASGSRSAVVRLAPGQLAGTGGRDPATTLTTGSGELGALVGMAFDEHGDLWVAGTNDSRLLEFTPEALATSGMTVASKVMTSVGVPISGPSSLAFDSRHRLWVANHAGGTIVRFDAAQLEAGGAQAPAVVIRTAPMLPTALAFDAAGALWVSDFQSSTVGRYAADQLEASAMDPAFHQVLAFADGVVNPAGIAFDADGNLWIANSGAVNVVAFTAGQLDGADPLSPGIVIGAHDGSLDVPVGLAFDGDGNLWVVGGGGLVTGFARASLASSGGPAPAALLTLTGHSLLWTVAFWPRPAGLPLQ